MPEADLFSMTLMVAVTLMTVAFALPWFMGSQTSRAARNAQQFLLLQSLAWLLILAAGETASPLSGALLYITGTSAAIGALWQLKKAVHGWLGSLKKGRRLTLMALCLLTLAGVLVLIANPPLRLAWFTITYGLSFATLSSLTLGSYHHTGKAWRYLFAVSGLSFSCMLLSRGYLIVQASLQHSGTEESLLLLQISWLMPLCSALFFLAILIACRDEENRQRAAEMPEDSLTGLPKKQAIKNQARIMLHRARRENLPLAMILLDMDYFSQVNRKYGYQTGNEALQLMSLTLQKQTRGDEVVVRWQGESFCLLVHADQSGVQALMTRIKSSIQMGAQYELDVNLDFSAGCALVPQVWPELHLTEISQQASAALQEAKKLGRGRVEFHVMMPPPSPPQS